MAQQQVLEHEVVARAHSGHGSREHMPEKFKYATLARSFAASQRQEALGPQCARHDNTS